MAEDNAKIIWDLTVWLIAAAQFAKPQRATCVGVLGKHDIMSKTQYNRKGILVHATAALKAESAGTSGEDMARTCADRSHSLRRVPKGVYSINLMRTIELATL